MKPRADQNTMITPDDLKNRDQPASTVDVDRDEPEAVEPVDDKDTQEHERDEDDQ